MSAADVTRHPVEELASDFLRRHRHGERPTVSDYATRHPELADAIREVFPLLLLLEVGERPGPSGNTTPPRESLSAAGPTRLGDYRIVREVGRGGMGVVYEAVHEVLGRRAAVKVLSAAAASEPGRRERFRREARLAAGLHHTNIVPVLDVGEHDGIAYFAMPFIEGRSLHQVVEAWRRDRPPADHPRRAADLVLQAAAALAHAHRHGVLHRDVKPANFLLDEPGTLWVADFGLACPFGPTAEGEAPLTATGDVVGTLRYLAPERFHRLADPRADLYGLGLTLYELLTLRPAFAADEPGPLVQQILRAEVVTPRQLNPTLPRDLETICLKCLQREPERRYASAAELADDLRRYLDDRAIRARRVGLLGQARRWCRRNPAIAGMGAVTTLAVLALLVASLYHNIHLKRALTETEEERAAARRAEQAALDYLGQARRAVDQMLTRVGHGRLRGVPQAEPVRRELLRDALGFYEGFLAQYGADPRLRHEAAQVLIHLGDAHQQLGDLPAAETAYQRAEGLLEALGDGEAVRRDLAAVRNQHGLLLQDTARLAEADACLRQSADLYRLLAAEHSATCVYRNHLQTVALNRANLLVRVGKQDEASQAYEQVATEARQVAMDFPNEPGPRQILYSALLNWSNLDERAARPREAETRLAEALQVARHLLRDAPEAPDARQRVAAALNQLGVFRRARRDPSGAAAALREAVERLETLAADFPSTPDFAHDLGGSLNNLALLARDQEDWPEVRRLAEQAVRWQQAARKAAPGQQDYRRFQRNHLSVLSGALLHLGEHVEASRVAEQWAEVRPEPAEDQYGAASVLARCVALAERDVRLASEERRRLAQTYSDRAMVHLRASLRTGPRLLPQVLTDPHLGPLRTRTDFRDLWVSPLRFATPPESRSPSGR